MQIYIDFEVFKALTALRTAETHTYNGVIRDLLRLPAESHVLLEGDSPDVAGWGGSSKFVNAAVCELFRGAYFGGIGFPEGTKFRATYKGQTHLAEIRDNQWIGSDDISRKSPSDAAKAITGNNVNGWRFWHVLRPGDPNWLRMDELK